MTTLYVTRQGAKIRRTANRFVVEHDGTAVAEIHDFRLERVVVIGNAQVTTSAVEHLLDRGIDTVFLSSNGRLKGCLTPVASRYGPLRIRQYERTLDRHFGLRIAQSIVAGKITNCMRVLGRYQRNHANPDVARQLSSIRPLADRVARTGSIDELLGIEGAAAAAYFRGLTRAVRADLGFTGRNRRPPRDPVNALLSFGYSLLYGEAIGALAGEGLDPCLGFLHSVDTGRFSLALDLMEEFRPLIVDRLVLRFVNRGEASVGDFMRQPDGGVRLDDKCRKRFLAAFEDCVSTEIGTDRSGGRSTLRGALRGQARALRLSVLGQDAYSAFEGWH